MEGSWEHLCCFTLFTCFTAIIIPNKFTRTNNSHFNWIRHESPKDHQKCQILRSLGSCLRSSLPPKSAPSSVSSQSPALHLVPMTALWHAITSSGRFLRRKKRPRDLQQQQKNVLTDIESEGTTITNARWIVYSHIIFVLDQWIPNYSEQLWWYWTVGSRSTEVGPFLCVKVDVGQLGASGGWYFGWCFASTDIFLGC